MKNLKIRLTAIVTALILVAALLGWLVPWFMQSTTEQIHPEHLAIAAFVFLGLCGVLFHGLLERALNPLLNLSDNFVRMRAGDLNPRLPVEGPEEIQQLARTFNDMMEELEVQIRDVTEEKFAAERGRQFLQEQLEVSQRFKDLVDSAPVGIVLADPELNISYQNSVSESGFLQLAGSLPWNTDVVVGRSLALLYPDEEEARGILGNPDRLPYEVDLTLGAFRVQFLAGAVYSGDGEYAGPMLLWDILGESEPTEVGPEARDGIEDLDLVFEEVDKISDFQEEEMDVALFSVEESVQEATSPPAVSEVAGKQVKRSATLVSRSVRLLLDRISTITSMVEALCNEGENLRRSLEETRQRTQNAAHLSTERSEAIWELVNEMNGLGERTRASALLVKRLRKSLNDVEAIPSTVRRLADTIDHMVVEARLEVGRAGDAGAGMQVVVDEVDRLGREARRLDKDVDEKLDRVRSEVEDMVSLLEEDRREVRTGGRLARRAEHALSRIERDLTDVDERTDLLVEMAVGQSEIGTHVASQLVKLTELVNVTVRVAREQVRIVGQDLGDAQDEPEAPVQEKR